VRTTLRMTAAGALVVVPLTLLGVSAVSASATPAPTTPTCRPGHDYGCQTTTSSPSIQSSTSPPTTAPPSTPPPTTPPPLPETGTSAGTIAVAGAALVGTGAALGLGALAFTRRRRFEA
jgi:hypothetical protein